MKGRFTTDFFRCGRRHVNVQTTIFIFDMKVDKSDAPKYILLNQSTRLYERSETASSILSHLKLLGMFDAG